jgi:hypothetical protein
VLRFGFTAPSPVYTQLTDGPEQGHPAISLKYIHGTTLCRSNKKFSTKVLGPEGLMYKIAKSKPAVWFTMCIVLWPVWRQKWVIMDISTTELTTVYDSLRQSTTFYDIDDITTLLTTVYDSLRQTTTNYDKQRQTTTVYDSLRHYDCRWRQSTTSRLSLTTIYDITIFTSSHHHHRKSSKMGRPWPKHHPCWSWRGSGIFVNAIDVPPIPLTIYSANLNSNLYFNLNVEKC